MVIKGRRQRGPFIPRGKWRWPKATHAGGRCPLLTLLPPALWPALSDAPFPALLGSMEHTYSGPPEGRVSVPPLTLSEALSSLKAVGNGLAGASLPCTSWGSFLPGAHAHLVALSSMCLCLCSMARRRTLNVRSFRPERKEKGHRTGLAGDVDQPGKANSL